jgi:uncharacterized pyridoxal phosphate-containing UPF0001 family protein
MVRAAVATDRVRPTTAREAVMTVNHDVAQNLTALHAAIRAAGGTDVTLVAASKAQPDERIDAALAAGQRVFGENYVQEAEAHWSERRAAWPDVELHLIGPLQTNKAKDAVRLFDVVESVDRERLAAALAKAEASTGLKRRYCVQVNTGEEPQKAGIAPTEAVAFVERARTVHGLDVVGLMAIPPADEPPGPHFALLAQLRHERGLPGRGTAGGDARAHRHRHLRGAAAQGRRGGARRRTAGTTRGLMTARVPLWWRAVNRVHKRSADEARLQFGARRGAGSARCSRRRPGR